MVWPFKFGAQHANLGDQTCSVKETFGLDFISHAERKMLKNGGDDDDLCWVLPLPIPRPVIPLPIPRPVTAKFNEYYKADPVSTLAKY